MVKYIYLGASRTFCALKFSGLSAAFMNFLMPIVAIHE